MTWKQDVINTIASPARPYPAKVQTIAIQKTPAGVLVVGFLSMSQTTWGASITLVMKRIQERAATEEQNQ